MKKFWPKNFWLANFFLLILLLLTSPSRALTPEEHLPDTTQEQRAINLFLQVRCLVCSGQVIESSNTEFSFQMRQLIRKKISQENKTDEEIKAELTKEFGADILTEPSKTTWQGSLIWLAPLAFGVALALGWLLVVR